MAESVAVVSRQLVFDLDNDTPVPAAEVLIDLKASARRRNNHQRVSASTHSSPRRRRNNSVLPGKRTVNSLNSSVHQDVAEDLEASKEYNSCKRRREEASDESDAEDGSHASQTQLQQLDKHLKLFLRLPKALSWCCHEWFYSDIDQQLLDGENDFCICLRNMFPPLKTRMLTHTQWRLIRRLIGKPRRCSAAFFAEERALLNEKRKKIRRVQRRVHQGVHLSPHEISECRDIPGKISAVLTVGTKVTAWLNTDKEKGFYTGAVEAVDLERSRYWVTFDRPGVEKHSVADIDIKSMSPPEMISLSALETHRLFPSNSLSTPPRAVGSSTVPHISPSAVPDVPDPFLTSSPSASRKISDHSTEPQNIGGFPVEFLKQVVQMSKLLSLKHDRVRRLADLNTEAEKAQARHLSLSHEFQRQYASVIIDLDDLNRQLNLRAEAIKSHCSLLGYGEEPQPLLGSAKDCVEHATRILEASNSSLRASGSEVKDPSVLNLISSLTSILLQIEMLSLDVGSPDLSILQHSLANVRQLVSVENFRMFQKHVEAPLTLVQAGMNPSDSLHPFSLSSQAFMTRTPHS